MLDEAAATGSGLITLERARMQAGTLEAAPLPEECKLTVYFGRQERVERRPAFVAVCDLLHWHGLTGASTLLGVDGTVHGRRERARFFARNAEVPVMVVGVGSGARIAEVLPELGGLVREPLVTVEWVRVCKLDGQLVEAPHEMPATDEHGLAIWQKLMIYTSEAQLHDGRPIHRELTQRLRRAGASGTTVVRGIWGFHGAHAPHGDRLFQRGRHVPVVTIVIDTPDKIAGSVAIVDELTAEHGLVTSEMVPAMRAAAGEDDSGGFRLARHDF